MQKLFALVLFAIPVSGCVIMPYDRTNTEEYHRFWSNEENWKNSFLYGLSEESHMERQGVPPARRPGF